MMKEYTIYMRNFEDNPELQVMEEAKALLAEARNTLESLKNDPGFMGMADLMKDIEDIEGSLQETISCCEAELSEW